MQINITSICVSVPAEHGINGLAELVVICLIDATGIHPKVRQSVYTSLFRAELNLLKPFLVLVRWELDIRVEDFAMERTPGMGKNRIRVSRVVEVVGQAKLAAGVALQEPHSGTPTCQS